MKLLGTTALVALVAGSVPAMALDFGNGFSFTGDVELEYITSGDGDDAAYGFADVTLGWRSQGGGAVGFGFDLNFVDFEDLDDGDGINAFWGGLVLTTSVGEFTVGNPRPLLATMIDTPDVGGVRIYSLELQSITGSLYDVLLLSSDDADSYGASFKGTTGAFTYGASYHTLDVPGIDYDVFELVATYQLGKTLIQGGAELIDTSGGSAEKLILGAVYEEDRWSAGVLYSKMSSPGSDVSAFKLYGDYAVTEALTVGAQVLTLDSGSDNQTIYGITGEYGFGAGGFAQLGAADADNGGDAIYQASIGYRF